MKKEEKEIYYKPVGGVQALILLYIISLLLCIFSHCSLIILSICGVLLAFETFRVINKRKEVIIINSKGILLYRVMGRIEGGREKENGGQTGYFVDWEEIKDIRFREFAQGIDLVIYHKRKGCLQMEISEYLSLFQGKRYQQFKKDVFRYYNSARKK